MSSEDLDGFEAESQMALYQEYQNVSELFTYVVETDRRFYLANEVQVTPHTANGTLFFEVDLTDVWVWDVFRPTRFVKNVHIYSVKDVNVEEKAQRTDLTVPDFSDPLQP